MAGIVARAGRRAGRPHSTKVDGIVQTREYICPRRLLGYGEDYEANVNLRTTTRLLSFYSSATKLLRSYKVPRKTGKHSDKGLLY